MTLAPRLKRAYDLHVHSLILAGKDPNQELLLQHNYSKLKEAIIYERNKQLTLEDFLVQPSVNYGTAFANTDGVTQKDKSRL